MMKRLLGIKRHLSLNVSVCIDYSYSDNRMRYLLRDLNLQEIGVKKPEQVAQTHAAWLLPLRKAVEKWIAVIPQEKISDEAISLQNQLILGRREIIDVENYDREFGSN